MIVTDLRRAACALLGACALALPACSPESHQPTAFDYDQTIQAARRAARPLQALYLVEAQAAVEGWTAAQLRLAGDLWRDLDDVPRALSYWEAASQMQPQDVALARTLAQVYVEMQRWPEAVDALKRYLRLRPDDAWADFELGLIYAASNPLEAESHLRETVGEPGYSELSARLLDIVTEGAGDRLVGMRAGMALAEADLWPYAELAFRYAAETNAPYPLALAYTGLARDRQGKDGAAPLLEALRLAPDDPQIQLLYGLHLRVAGEPAASVDAFVRAVALDPENPAYHAELGAAYQLLGDLTRAEYWLNSAVAVSNGDPRFRELLAAFYADEADHLTDAGVEVFEALAETAGEDPDVRAGLSWALHRAGRTEEARAQLESVLDAAPDNARALYYKGRILLETDQAEEAIPWLQRAAATDSRWAAEAALLLERLAAR